ncbi:P-loop containing nucleoside triphosphate hydrolase protein [Dichotomocladium elegans]|nr:P-loop containing nucleoside triphosphate hydrolase protein [Dichotomocladium elegans]
MACDYFRWDTSASPYAQHPAEAYALAQPSRGLIQSFQQTRNDRAGSSLNTPASMKTKVRFTLATTSTIVIDIAANATMTVMAVLDAIAKSQDDTRWEIPATYESYQHALRALPTGAPNLKLEILPLSLSLSKTLKWLALPDTAADIRETEVEERMLKLRYYEGLWMTMKPFQKKSVREAVRRDGRVMLADDAGLGKTMQAMGVMATFDDDWPVLIVCPIETHSSWVEHLIEWLLISRDDICIMQNKGNIGLKRKRRQKQPARRKHRSFQASWAIGSGDEIHSEDDGDNDSVFNTGVWASNEGDVPIDLFSDHKIYIATFEAASKFKKEIEERNFRFIVCDESHHLSKRNSVINRNLVPIMQNTDHLLLLWNNPDLARPADLFSNLHALRKDMFPDFQKFGKAFCDGKQQILGWDYSGKNHKEWSKYVDPSPLVLTNPILHYKGLSNQVELRFILDHLLWIRRTKEDVKDELPF